MNRFKFLSRRALLPALILLVLVGCSKVRIQKRDSKTVVHYSEYFSSIKGADDFKDIAFYLDKGEAIPLRLELDTLFFEISKIKHELVLRQKIYGRIEILKECEETFKPWEDLKKCLKMVEISPDAITWTPIYDVKSIKGLFKIEQSRFVFSFTASKKTGTQLDYKLTFK